MQSSITSSSLLKQISRLSLEGSQRSGALALVPLMSLGDCYPISLVSIRSMPGTPCSHASPCTRTPDATIRAGGSAANVARSLASAFGVKVGLIGSVGSDKWGTVFAKSLQQAHVDTTRIRATPGATKQCVVLTDGNQRTMRSAGSSDCPSFTASMLEEADTLGAKW